MSQKIFNIRFALTGIIIILSYYFYVIFLKLDPNNNLSISINKNFFLSLGILTDLTYLDLLMREKLPIINSNYNFLNIFYSIDRSLIKIFGLESFWIFNIFYKLISFLILYFGFNKLFNFKKKI